MSHFWLGPDHPDPDGEYLRLNQGLDANQAPDWSYMWVDWSCLPQQPRTPLQEAYFRLALPAIPNIIQNCGLTYFYPPFAARLWILFEVAMTAFTMLEGLEGFETSDIQTFTEHAREMLQTGVSSVLQKYSYKCSSDLDKHFLTSWLEVLVILKRLSC